MGPCAVKTRNCGLLMPKLFTYKVKVAFVVYHVCGLLKTAFTWTISTKQFEILHIQFEHKKLLYTLKLKRKWFTFINLVKKRFTFVYSKLKLQSTRKLGYIDERYKVTSGEAQSCPAANNQAQVCVLRCHFKCRHQLSTVNNPCVRLASSVRRASKRKSVGHGFESHVRLTLYLESKNLSTTMNIIYITSFCLTS